MTAVLSERETEPAIKSVHVFSTGSVAQHEEHRYGSRLPALWWVLMSRSWVEIPINVFLIEHRNGLVLFDTGMDPAIRADPSYISSPLGRWLLDKIFQLSITPEDSLTHKLEALGFSAADVKLAIVSHLHFDHVGGISEIPDAELLVSAKEWEQLSALHPEHDWILREHIELPSAKWCQIDFTSTDDPLLRPFGSSYDIFADGSMILLPTPGHTVGSMSLLVKSEDFPPLLCVGDLTYELDMLMNDRIPGRGDASSLLESFAKVRALKEQLPNLIILPSHDSKASDVLRSVVEERGS